MRFYLGLGNPRERTARGEPYEKAPSAVRSRGRAASRASRDPRSGDRGPLICVFRLFRPGGHGAELESGTACPQSGRASPVSTARSTGGRRDRWVSLRKPCVTREPTPGRSLDPKRCSVNVKSYNLHTSVTFERSCVPPKTHRIWNGRQPPDRLPLSFWRYAWPFKSYRGVKIITFHLHAAPFGIRTPSSSSKWHRSIPIASGVWAPIGERESCAIASILDQSQPTIPAR